MAEYTDLTCPVCGQAFKQDDDIVVCPQCGTPHHRSCYAQLGHCAHTEWHEENRCYDSEEERGRAHSENSENDEQDEQNEKIICKRCGNQNQPGAIFCSKCGSPVSLPFNDSGMGNMSFSPFVKIDMEEKLDGVETWKLSAAVRENKLRFLPQFKAFAQAGRKISFNFCSFIFSPFYFFYRKMYLPGLVTLIIFILLNIPGVLIAMTPENFSKIVGSTVSFGIQLTTAQQQWLGNLSYFCSIGLLAFRLLCGLFTNYLYFSKCKKLCEKVDLYAAGKDDFTREAERRGGVNKAVIIVLVALYVLSVWATAFFLVTP